MVWYVHYLLFMVLQTLYGLWYGMVWYVHYLLFIVLQTLWYGMVWYVQCFGVGGGVALWTRSQERVLAK